ncbi:hypothetical protein [Nocardia pseudobrasiliensis]|uniref:Uncharacterized protein n=1 Tax=Nocardia pseudobrasiliensis TaxID=45979 RepID=A0A370IBL4_9NOCA|nr:hypothetical protein [Nocardia pseudobrasiliensis]RDI68125.1 hypothetical protein DFR76_102526 [Nocardia pseudobrasiliensis]
MSKRDTEMSTEQWLLDLERSLRRIERSVLDETRIGHLGRSVLILAAAGVAITASSALATPVVMKGRPGLMFVALVLAAAVVVGTGFGVTAQRFSWSCANAILCGIAAVISVLAFWAGSTGSTLPGAGWFVLTAASQATLTVTWAGIALRDHDYIVT